MKRFLAVLFAAVVLAGCGGGGDPVSKTCSMDGPGGHVSIVFDAEGDTVKKATMNVSMGYEAMGITKDDVDKLSEKEKQKNIDSLTEAMNLDEIEGADVKSSFDDEGLKIEVVLEVSTVEQMFNKSSLEEVVKYAEGMGYTCK